MKELDETYGPEKANEIRKNLRQQFYGKLDTVITTKQMGNYEQQHAIRILRNVLLGEQKKRNVNVQPEALEMEVYYFLSEIQEIPETYVLDWPASLMK